MKIPIIKPYYDQKEMRALERVMRSGWVTQGPEVAQFEQEFARYVGAKHACAVSSCTAALHLALLAVGVRPGDEVITVSHSFVATANAIRYAGALPIFIDIDPDTFNMDPGLIERVMTKRTKAILCVHQIGMPCDLKRILAVARKHALYVIEDAACAVGSEIKWKGRWEKIGKPHGDIACFSFHPRKVLTTGDGGMITTSNPKWDRAFRLLRQHGMSISDTTRHRASRVLFESYDSVGFNYRMTDLQAAVGREQLKKLPQMVKRRRALANRYHRQLMKIPGLRIPKEPHGVRSNWQSYCVYLPARCNQRRVMQSLLDRGIAARRGVMCAHRERAYQKEPWSCGRGPGRCGCPQRRCRLLRQSEQAQDHTLLLPLYHTLSLREQRRVVVTLAATCKGK